MVLPPDCVAPQGDAVLWGFPLSLPQRTYAVYVLEEATGCNGAPIVRQSRV
jgi:hypothetical protein